MTPGGSTFARDGALHADMPFRDRFALESFEEGGLLLDVETGNYFELDGTAARVCRAMCLAEPHGGVVRAICDDLRIEEIAARRSMDDVIAALGVVVPRNPPEGPLRYARQDDGYVYRHGTTTVVHVDDAGQTLRLVGGGHVLGISDCIRAVTPKILAHQGATVLHAAAVSVENRLLAFSGPSGAGKTTTARALARSSDELISEDLMILKIGTDSVGVVSSAEPFIRRWQAETEQEFRLNPNAAVSCQILRGLTEGPVIPLREISFLGANRRRGDSIQREPLSRPASVRLLLENVFLGTADPARWRQHLRQARVIVDFVRVSRLTVPDGIDRLTEAARVYRTISAS